MVKYFAGLDVATETTNICVADANGEIVFETVTATTPVAIARALAPYKRRLARVAQETGGLAPWLHRELVKKKLPIECLDARATRAALRAQRNKTDRNDARGIALLIRQGFAHTVHIKSDRAFRARLLLTFRRALRRKARDLANTQARALRTFGIGLGPAASPRGRKKTPAADPFVTKLSAAMTRAREALASEIAAFDVIVDELTKNDPVCRRLMTVPGVGPLTALTFHAAVDDPARFSKSRLVAAHFGLTPRRVQSGQFDFAGRLSKFGDQSVRTALYEAAASILTHVRKPSALLHWGKKLLARRGFKFAAVACARKLAVVLHRIWVSGEAFKANQAALS